MAVFQNIVNSYFNRRALPSWCILLLDCSLAVFSLYAGIYVGVKITSVSVGIFGSTMGVLVGLVFFVVFSRLFHTYSGVIRYSTFSDLRHIGISTFCTSTCVFVVYASFEYHVLRSVIILPGLTACVIFFILSTTLMWLVRITVREIFRSSRINEYTTNAFVFGVRDGAIAVADALQMSSETDRFKVVGFVSPDGYLVSSYLKGVKVYSNTPELPDIMARANASTLFISPLQISAFNRQQNLINDLVRSGIRIYMMHEPEAWDGSSRLQYSQFHEVQVEDLLQRDEITVDMESIAAEFREKTVLVTGAAGSIGSEIVRQVAAFSPKKMILIDQAESPMHEIRLMMNSKYAYISSQTIVTSITNKEHMEQVFSTFRPDYVFHAAAYKHVPMMEDNPSEAVQNNVYGTRVIADLSVKYGVGKFVMISTDKAVNPTNVMGCSKRICEIYCQSLNRAIQEGKVKGVTQFVTTRFGNVLGSNGSVIPLFREQIKNGGPVTVTHPDIVRYFMLIPEACKLVLEAGAIGKGGEIYVFDMGNPVKIVDLARRMIALSGAKNVSIKFTGLRDGEKLYEEVLADTENTIPTSNPKIMVAKVREYDYEDACRNEERLLDASRTFDPMEVVRVMKEIVPEYRSQHSVYEQLDPPLPRQAHLVGE